MQSGQTLLFVYGTLKRGHRAQHLMKRARFLGEARTTPGYQLVDCRGYPGLVPLTDSNSVVHGEIHAVDHAHLAELDDYEGLAEGEYIRSPILLIGGDGDALSAQAYLYNRPWEHLPEVGEIWLPVHETH